ncbi:hypothetical protein [Clostridium botulinum]|nr:hypothetical protein [Clostridium botulinum]
MNNRLERLSNIIQQRISNLEDRKSNYSKGKTKAYKDILNLLKII